MIIMLSEKQHSEDIEETAKLLMKKYGYSREIALRQAYRWS